VTRPISDSQPIRGALVARLLADIAHGPALILHELAVGSGTPSRVPVEPRWYTTRGLRYYVSERNYCAQPSSARADVAVLTRDSLDLYEIKGPGDSLARLRTQVRAYDDTGSRNTLVVDERHLRHAYDAVPATWGIIVSAGERSVELRDVRMAALNPSRNVRGLSNPLYRRELLPLAHAYRARPGSRDDMVLFFAQHGSCNIELHERWLRRQIAARERAIARGPFGIAAGLKKHPAIEAGGACDWNDERLDVLIAALRARYAGAQLEFALAAD
jgi:hypothetical protein